MSKVTSKLQVTLPKALAREYEIKPGDEILWVAAGDSIRVVPPGARTPKVSVADKLKAFDQATTRQLQRQTRQRKKTTAERGWQREDLYRRGRSR